MDYGVQVGDLSEKVKADVAVIGSPATLDDKSWTAISAISPIAGHLEFYSLIDAAITQPSKRIPVVVGCYNLVVYTGAGETASVALASIWDYFITAYSLSADGTTWIAISSTTLLEPGMVIILAVTQDCILEGDWAASYTEADLPVTIPCGHPVLATVLYYNDDPYSEHTLHCTVEFLDPDGLIVGSGKTAALLSPGEYAQGWSWTDILALTTLDKPGTWKVHAVLTD